MRAHILTCARFGQWPFATPAHAATYVQTAIVLLAQRSEDDEAKPWPKRYLRDWQAMVIRKMQHVNS